MAATLRTRLCELLDIEAPILAAPMGFITGPELAAAVSNAGGLGIMSFSANPPPVLRDDIRRLRPNAPHRTLLTPFVERWLPEEKRGSEGRPDEPSIGETTIGGQRVSLLRFMGFPPTPEATGDLESMDFLAGQGVGLVREMKPAAEVVEELVEGARRIVSSLTTERET